MDSLCDNANLKGRLIESSGLDEVNVDDHVDLRRTVADGIFSLELLNSRSGITVRETDYRTDIKSAVSPLCRIPDVAWLNAD